MKDRTTKRKDIIAGNEVSEVVPLSLGGFDQKVMVEGKRRDLPVLIVLHGGPGSPIPFSVGSRGMFPDFTDRFLLVCWDQLGCGINDHKIDESFSIDSFVAMTEDLVKALKASVVNSYSGNISLWREILALDLSETLMQVKVPYLIMEGTSDVVASVKTVDALVSQSNNPLLKAEKVEHAGHLTGALAMKRIFEALCEMADC